METADKPMLVRVKIVAETGWLASYNGQHCDALIYQTHDPQIDTEQLTPPMPRYQTVRRRDIEEL
jgi:hypothetical protein